MHAPPVNRKAELASRVRREPNLAIRKGAQVYNALMGLSPIVENHYADIDVARAHAIADAYEALPIIDVGNPNVARAYEAFVVETRQQWDFATCWLGITFEPWLHLGQPYADSHEMMKDIKSANHLYFFIGGEQHPVLNVIDPETEFNPNDMFRAVHDVFGHAAEGYGFGPRGEKNAWIKHSQMYTPDAQKALTTETYGQNCWTNFGRHNYDERGSYRNLSLEERPFPPQKAAVLPGEFLDWQEALQLKWRHGR